MKRIFYASLLIIACLALLPLKGVLARPPRTPSHPHFTFLNPVPSLHHGTWRKVGPFTILGQTTVIFLTGELADGTVSNDGQRFIMAYSPWTASLQEAVIANLSSSYIRTVNIPNLKYFDRGPIIDTYWDLRDTNYIFVSCGENLKDDKYRGVVYRVNRGGTHKVKISGDDDTHMIQPTPDGRWVLMVSYGPPKRGGSGKITGDNSNSVEYTPVYYLQSLSDPHHQRRVSWDQYIIMNSISPNSRYLSGQLNERTSPKYSIGIFDRSIGKVVLRISQEKFIPGRRNNAIEISKGCWLPDSSGLILQVHRTDSSICTGIDQLWYVSRQGRIRQLVNGVDLLGNSMNGLHWLFRIKGRYYLYSVKPAR